MKHILSAGFLLSTTFLAHAGQQPRSPGECLEMYRTYLMNYSSAESLPADVPVDFTTSCLPDTAQNRTPQYIRLMQLMENDQQIIALEARMLERGFIEPGNDSLSTVSQSEY